MKKLLHFILIILFSLTVISCAKKVLLVVTHQVDYLLLWGIMEKFLRRLMEP